MIDQVHILIQAGDGGNGGTSFQPRMDKKLVASGGDGGNGGRVIVRASDQAPSLETYRFKQHWIAEAGAHGTNNNKRGRNGTDLVLVIPEGARLYDRRRSLVIRERLSKSEEFLLLEGGRGGKGNSNGRESTQGQKGGQIDLEITTRILADVFLVGLPNSGKSSLLNRLTRAQVPVEIYPFSTREPRLGVFAVSDYEALKLCEMPSLYRGSSENKGLGNHFLRHLEAAKLLLLVLDPLSEFAPSLKEGLEILKEELSVFSPELKELPHAVIVNKMDLKTAEEKAALENFQPAGERVFFISALTGLGLAALENFLRNFYEQPT